MLAQVAGKMLGILFWDMGYTYAHTNAYCIWQSTERVQKLKEITAD